MKPLLRPFVVILIALIFLPGGLCLAQSQPKPKLVTVKEAVPPDATGGTMIKKAPVKSQDGIVLLQTDPSAKSRETRPIGDAPATQATYTPAEIAAVQQQLKDKQKQVELLMRMFNTDERPFLNDPSAQPGEGDAVAKRHFEQEELRKTSAEVAALRGKLEQMNAGAEKTVEQKP